MIFVAFSRRKNHLGLVLKLYVRSITSPTEKQIFRKEKKKTETFGAMSHHTFLKYITIS